MTFIPDDESVEGNIAYSGSPPTAGAAIPEMSYEGREAVVGPDISNAEIPDPNVDAEWRTILGKCQLCL